MRRPLALVAMLAVAIGGCGDDSTSRNASATKSPHPTATVSPGYAAEVARFGHPLGLHASKLDRPRFRHSFPLYAITTYKEQVNYVLGELGALRPPARARAAHRAFHRAVRRLAAAVTAFYTTTQQGRSLDGRSYRRVVRRSQAALTAHKRLRRRL